MVKVQQLSQHSYPHKKLVFLISPKSTGQLASTVSHEAAWHMITKWHFSVFCLVLSKLNRSEFPFNSSGCWGGEYKTKEDMRKMYSMKERKATTFLNYASSEACLVFKCGLTSAFMLQTADSAIKHLYAQ